MKILISGGAGFIGHHLVDYLLRETDAQLTLIDRLDDSGNLNRLAEIGARDSRRVRFVFHDLKAAFNDQLLSQIGPHEVILHLAAATHVDRSISDPLSFVMDNVVGTCTMLDFARKVGCSRFVQFSTDEVFGPAPPGVRYQEDDRYRSGNPYAATKAGAEELALAYHNTYRVPVLVTHTMNVIGRRQHPEKFVPMTISKILSGERVQIHANALRTVSGSRFYIDAQCVARAIFLLIGKGVNGEKYNLVGNREISNLELAKSIAYRVGQPMQHDLVDFHSSRPGHDLRYALDGSKMAALGFQPKDITTVLDELVPWTMRHSQWLALFSKPRAA